VLRNHKHQYKHDHREFSGEFHFVLADSFDSKCFEFATVVSSKSTKTAEGDVTTTREILPLGQRCKCI